MINFIILFSISIAIFIITIFLSSLLYKDKRKFSLFNTFPYECFLLNDNYKINRLKLLFIVPLMLLIGAAISLVAFVEKELYLGLIPVNISLTIFGCASFALLSFLSPKNIKIYLLFFVILFVSSIMGCALNIYTFVLSLHDIYQATLDIKKIICGGIALCLLLFAICLFISTNASKSFKMTRIDKEDGTYDLIRPKKFPLAYFQWFSIILIYLSNLLLFIQVL